MLANVGFLDEVLFFGKSNKKEMKNLFILFSCYYFL